MNFDVRPLFLTATVLAAVPMNSAPIAMLKPTDKGLAPPQNADASPSAAGPEEDSPERIAGTRAPDTVADVFQTKRSDAITVKQTAARTASSKPTPLDGRQPDALRCLALNVYHEARSESKTGQVAVAAVTLNRVKSTVFPNSVCKVVKQGGQQRNRCQFSWWCDGKRDHPTEPMAWQEAQQVARLALQGATEDPTDGALYYHADYVKPRWARKLEHTARIGNHLFYRPAQRQPVRIAAKDELPDSWSDPVL